MQQIQCPRCLGIFACRTPRSANATCCCTNCGFRFRLFGQGPAAAELSLASRPVIVLALVAIVSAVVWTMVFAWL